MKKSGLGSWVAVFAGMSVFLFFTVPVLAEDDEVNVYDAGYKARQAHEKAASDMMYQNEEWKAMYYQNEQIIQLLKELRDEMRSFNARAAKEEPKSA